MMINVKKVSRDLKSIRNKIEKIEDIATTRALNIVATRARAMIANDVKEDTGIPVAQAKRRIDVDKATRIKKTASLHISARRVVYPGARKLKMGASFIGAGKIRRKVTHKIRTNAGTGSRPFVIKGQYSGKKLPVYVDPQFVGAKTAKGRKVRAMYYSSLAHVARKDWQQKVDKFSIKEMRVEYPKQLKKANKGVKI